MPNTVSLSISLKQDADPEVVGRAIALLVSQSADPASGKKQMLKAANATSGKITMLQSVPTLPDFLEA